MVGLDPKFWFNPTLPQAPIVGGKKSDIWKFNPNAVPEKTTIKKVNIPNAPLVAKPTATSAGIPDLETFMADKGMPISPVKQQGVLQPTTDYLAQEWARIDQWYKTSPIKPEPLTWVDQQLDTTINFTLADLKADITDWMPREELYNFYQNIPTEIVDDLYNDINDGMPLSEAKKFYPELYNMQPSEDVAVAGTDRYEYNIFNKPTKFLQDLQTSAEDIDIPVIEPLAQWAIWALQWGVKWLRDVTQWGAELLDKWIASATDTQEQYKSSVSENVFDMTQWFINTAAAVYAPVAMAAFGTTINSLPEDAQIKVAETIGDIGKLISEVPWLKQFKESLPQDRWEEFDQEVAGATIGLILGTKNKANIIKNPKLFIKENMNVKSIMRNMQENVVGIPASKIKWAIPEVKAPSIVKKAWEKVSVVDQALWRQFWLDAATVNTFRQMPDLVKDIDEGKMSKESLIKDLENIASESKTEQSNVGKLYKDVYENLDTFSSYDVAKTIENSLINEGIKIKDGKVTWYDSTKISLSPAEFSAIKTKYDNIVKPFIEENRQLSVEELHNVRKDIYNTSYSEWAMTKKAKGMDIISHTINNEYLHNVPWFKEADQAFKEVSGIVQEVRKLIVNKDWQFKWTIKALLNEKQMARLEKLEEYMPWLTRKLEAIKAYDDFVRTSETQKTGTYAKALGSFARQWGASAIWYAAWWWLGSVIANGIMTAIDSVITDPNLFKNYIKRYAGDVVMEKLENNKPISIAEKAKIEIALKKWEESINKTVKATKQQEKTVIENNMQPNRIKKAVLSKQEDVITSKKQENWLKSKRSDAMEALQKKDMWLKQEKYKTAWLEQKTISKWEARDIVNKYFTDDEITVVFKDKITTETWQDALWSYYDKMISFAKDPKKWVPEHEVVHAYIDLFKSNIEKNGIMEYVLKNNKQEVDSIMSKIWVKDKYIWAEEVIADWFIKYVQWKATFTGKIQDFFQTLWNDIKKVFWKEDKVQALYKDIVRNKRPRNVEWWLNKKTMYSRNIDEDINDLVALHNLNQDKLSKVVDLWGMPMPSIAITKRWIPFEEFWDITLVGKKSMIDPLYDSKNKVYSSDAYTPRVPEATVQIKKDKYVKDRIEEIAKEVWAKSWDVEEFFKNEHWNARYMLEKYPLLDKFKKETSSLTDKKLFKWFTASGTRKYSDYDLDTIVADMKKAWKWWESNMFTWNLNQMIAKKSNNIKNISDIKQKYAFWTKEELKSKYDNLQNRYDEVIDRLAWDTFVNRFAPDLSDAYNKNLNVWKNKLEWRWHKIDIEDLKELDNIINEWLSLPKSYIEAKPERPVKLREFEYALVPEEQLDSVKLILKWTALEDKVIWYKKWESRTNKLSEIQQKYWNVFFSLFGVLFPMAYFLWWNDENK